MVEARHIEVCPGCGLREFKATGPHAPPIVQRLGGHEFHQPVCRVLECVCCGLLFKTPTPTTTDLSANYDVSPTGRYDYGGLLPTERVVHRLLSALEHGSVVLDFGCNTGRLLNSLPSHLVKHGFEISENAASVAAASGIHMIRADDWLSPKKPVFDAIVLVDVFEHLDSPTDTLCSLWQCLKPGGSLIVSTGNGDHWACRLDPARFWYFRSYEHLCMITRRYAEYFSALRGAHIGSWSESCHYADPLRVRLRSHATHAVYWLHRLGPGWLKALVGGTPAFQNIVNAECPPTYACCKDHVIVSWKKADCA